MIRAFSVCFCFTCFFIVPLFSFSQSTKKAGPLYEEHVVWNYMEDSLWPYQLPNILVTDKGTLLAYSDARIKQGDGAPSHVVMKRSEDHGKTWSKNMFLGNSDKGQNFLFPCGIQDRVTREIFFFYALRPYFKAEVSEVLVRRSSDDGKTWSEPENVTRALIVNDSLLAENIHKGFASADYPSESSKFYGRRIFLTGPGTAIQLRSNHPIAPNRMILPVFAMKSRWDKLEDRGYGNTILFSDDHGKTWKAGGIVPLGDYASSELTIAELSDGSLVINARLGVAKNTHLLKRRTISVSSDAGKTWSVPKLDVSGIPLATNVGTGLVTFNFPEEDANSKGRLLYSYPNDSLVRRNISVLLSYDDHKSWSFNKKVYDSTTFYSNMAVSADKFIYLIYGRDTGTRMSNKLVYLSRFNLQWLTDGKDSFVPAKKPAKKKR